MLRIRAEEKALLIWNMEYARAAYISDEELQVIEQWTSGKNSGFSDRLKKLGIVCDSAIPKVKEAIVTAAYKKAPPRSFCAPESLHIELTSRCPFECSQCYKDCSGVDLSYEILFDAVKQADEMNVFQIALGGGEPLVYPYLIPVVAEIRKRGMASSITTSGFGLSNDLLSALKRVGLNHVQISLNGSCREVHSRSRDGYEYGVDALELLKNAKISFGINWVARMDNIDDLINLIEVAKNCRANNVNVLRYKPSPKESYENFCLTFEKLNLLESIIRNTKDINIRVDSAFSNLLCHMNKRTSFFSGCGAGRRFLALDADGYYRPCSHVDMKEESGDLQKVWYHSTNLAMFRSVAEKISEPCLSCRYMNGCFGCRSVVLGQGDDFFSGDRTCAYSQSSTSPSIISSRLSACSACANMA